MRNGKLFTIHFFQKSLKSRGMYGPADPKFGSPDKAAPCPPCQTRLNKDIYPRNHSTRWYHDNLRAENKDEVECEVCKTTHSIMPHERGRICIFTTSTLHNIYMDPRVKPEFHIDIESICGGRLLDLYRAWKAAYGEDQEKTHIILVSGLNDVTKLTSEAFINVVKMWEYELFHLNPGNTLRVCKLLRPPKLCWLPGNGPIPNPGYVNYLTKIQDINTRIDKYNEERGHGKVIGFACDGCRAKRGKLGHKFSDWREVQTGPEACLHLNNEKRFRMYVKLERFIRHGVIPDIL